jgi:PBP1b-binding outer membrane lipoprotein LpoB
MRHLPILLFAFALAGCSAPTPPPTDQPPEPQADPQAAAQHARDTQLRDAIQRPIDKAKGVEDTTLKAADEQKQQIEDAGG